MHTSWKSRGYLMFLTKFLGGGSRLSGKLPGGSLYFGFYCICINKCFEICLRGVLYLPSTPPHPCVHLWLGGFLENNYVVIFRQQQLLFFQKNSLFMLLNYEVSLSWHAMKAVLWKQCYESIAMKAVLWKHCYESRILGLISKL